MKAYEKQDQRQNERRKRLTEEKIYSLLWRMALPSMIGMMVSAVYSMTDTFFVGMLNRPDLTASVGIVFSFTSMIQAIGFWFGYGAGNYASRQIGKKNTEEARKVVSVAMILAVVVGISILALGLIFIRPFAAFLGADVSDSLMNATISYLRITLISVPFMLAANVLYNVLRLQGSARDSMLGMLVGMLLNILLDPVFIFGFDMGVAGAALASMLGQMSGLFVLLIFSKRSGNVVGGIGKISSGFIYIKEILMGGAPNFCRQGISSISTILFNQAAGYYGESGVAGVTVALRILAMAYALVIGFGQGFQPICLVNFGAGKLHRVKEGFRDALITVTIFLAVTTFLLFLNVNKIAGLFTQDTKALAITVDILKAQCLVLPFMGYYILIGMLLQNIGRFGCATLVTVAENGLFLMPTVFLLPVFFGYSGFIWCKSIASVAALVFSFVIGTKVWMKYLKDNEGRDKLWKSIF